MFVRGTVLGIISSKPVINMIPSAYSENRRMTKLKISTYKRKYKEVGFTAQEFEFVLWGDLPNIDIYDLKEGDMVHAEFQSGGR